MYSFRLDHNAEFQIFPSESSMNFHLPRKVDFPLKRKEKTG